MSEQAMNAVIARSKASGASLAVLLELARRADGELLVSVGNDELAAVLKRDVRSIQRALAELRRGQEIHLRSKRPRVFLVDPRPAGTQLDLLSAGVTFLSPVTSKSSPQGDSSVVCHDETVTPSRARAAMGSKSLTSSTSLTSGAAVEDLAPGEIVGGVPRRPLAERLVERRQRRRARRNTLVADALPCPGAALDDALPELLAAAAAQPGQLAVWLATGSAHLHVAGATLELGVAPQTASHLAGRYGRLLEQLAGRPVVVVPCQGPESRS